MHRSSTLFLALILVLLAAGAIMAQAPATVHWSLNATDSARVSAVSGNARGLTQTHGDSFMCRDYANGPGPDQRWYPYNFNTKKAIMWGPDTTQNENVWVQFAVLPKAYNDFHADSMTIYLGGKGTDKVFANLWFDTHADFSSPVPLNDAPLAMKKDGDSLFAFILDKEVPDGDTLYVRVYAWHAGTASNSKYLYMRLCTIYGTTTANPIPASATWACTNPGAGGTGQTVATAGNVLAADEKLVNMNINGYTGFNSAQRLRIVSAPGKYEWPAGQLTQIDSVYVEFSVSPKLGTRFMVNSLSLDLGCHSINNFKANVWYSKDPAFANPVQIVFQTADTVNNYLPRGPDIPAYTVTAQPGLLLDPGETFYLRVYPWVHDNASATSGKYLTVQNVLIGGVSESAPMPSSATWACTNPGTGGTGQTVATAGKVTAADEKLVNMNINGYTGFNSAQRVRIISAPGKYEWPAGQLTQIDSVYVEFAVSPKAGAKFTVQSLSLDLGCHSINNFKANVWYSKDPAFTNPVQIVFQTADTVNNYLPRGPDIPAITVTAQPDLIVDPVETFYLRVYPWVHDNAGVTSGKYLTIQNVVISGLAEGGADYEMPVIVTTPATYISTTFTTSGGSIPSDGGAPVTERGVCWSTVTGPTTADAKTTDGGGSGAFVSKVTGLTAGVTYFLRAYATNDAGTAYGEEVSFKTLDSLVVPTVTTVAVNNIMVKSARSGGNVTEWGGSDVTARGICWNMTGDPTILDEKTENGTGIGAFTSSLSPLTANTTYYVRAYATNATGTGYGAVETFTSQSPAPAVLKVVAQDGSGDYTTVQAAFNDVPDFYTGMWFIYVKAGTYKEKLMLALNKTNVVLKGENAMTTILTYDDYAGKPGIGGTSNCYSTAIEADDFTAVDITFQNTVKNDGTFPDQQGVALRVNGDRGSFYNCRLLGYQDTYYAWGGHGTVRTYMKECYIEGSVDFIFGRNINVFDNCHIHVNRQSGCITAPSTDAASKFGFVFMNCKITADSVGFNGVPITSFHLGRPWQGRPQCVYLNCEEPATLSPEGWTVMTNGLNPLFAEFHCFGAGSNFFGRINGGIQLSEAEAAEYTLANIFAKTSNPNLGFDWMPEKPIFTDVEWSKGPETLPTVYELSQNYPNPFNPVTTIHYALPKPGKVRITIYNILGSQVATLVDRQQAAGRYTIRFDGLNLGSGTYFYRIDAADFHQTKKMLLLK